ncbi:hypothetical protein OUZ56_027083 [Daphnia magna]|uniref:Uncharacterized protein n=1 Tax=Daphnia magna TaxID=35525 RepID=A0ABQ9ZPF3_9CRUS|nr:hypothetical protein OUZ56_027083 [Daphnia magna]
MPAPEQRRTPNSVFILQSGYRRRIMTNALARQLETIARLIDSLISQSSSHRQKRMMVAACRSHDLFSPASAPADNS